MRKAEDAMTSDTPRLDKLYDMVSEREGPCKTGDAPSKWSYEAILDLTDFARTLERENAALHQQAEIGRQWQENSSLEKWFPYTAEQLAALQAEVTRLTENQRLQDSATAAVMERSEKLTARVAELERDAERYRWLRDDDRGRFLACAAMTDTGLSGDIDAAIDAARGTE